MKTARSPAQKNAAASARSCRPTAARCSSMKSAICRSRSRCGSCACCRSAAWCRSAARAPFRSTCGSSALTHRNLRAMIEEGTFREDLYYRINGLVVTLPALRERTDLEALIARVLELQCEGDGVPRRVSPQVLERLHAMPLARQSAATGERAAHREHHGRRRGSNRTRRSAGRLSA